jgi:hypothetical protein
VKEHRDTFGPGWSPEVRARLKSESLKDRLEVLHAFVERSLRHRCELMRLKPEERGQWNQELAGMRKQGMALLQQAKAAGTAGAMQGMNDCPSCDGANAGSER